MTASRLALFAAAFAVAAAAEPSRAATSGSVLLTAGSLRSDFSQDHPQLGVELSGGPGRWPLRVTAYAAGSYEVTPCFSEECRQAHQSSIEAGVGLRGVWSTRRLQASIGAGPSWAKHRTELEDPEAWVARARFDWRSSGWWAGGEGLFRVLGRLGIGGGARYTRLNGTEDDVELESWSIHGTIGWLWPGAGR